MKIHPFKIPKVGEQSLIFQVDEEVVFYNKLHQHEELQITFIEKGEGKILVGDSIHPYYSGNVFLLGSNLPHVFISDSEEEEKSVMKTIFFNKTLFSVELVRFPELAGLIPMIEASNAGIHFTQHQHQLGALINEFGKEDAINRVILFLRILKLMSTTATKRLSTFIYSRNYSELEGKRMSSVMNYTVEHFASTISLEEVASIANMNKNAFCRYFRQRTNKTYFQFLIEIRIENACKELIRNKERSIVEVAESCGFQNISNFNRKFRELKHTSPFNYRKQQSIQLEQLN